MYLRYEGAPTGSVKTGQLMWIKKIIRMKRDSRFPSKIALWLQWEDEEGNVREFGWADKGKFSKDIMYTDEVLSRSFVHQDAYTAVATKRDAMVGHQAMVKKIPKVIRGHYSPGLGLYM